MANKFTEKAQNVLEKARAEAEGMGHTYIGSEHLLLGLVCEKSGIAAKILYARKARAASIRSGIEKAVGIGSPSSVKAYDMTPRLKKIIEGAAAESLKNGKSYIGTEHLLFSLLQERDSVACTVLEELDVSVAELKNDLIEFFASSIDRTAGVVGREPKKSAKNDHGKSAHSIFSFGRDLTAAAREGKLDPIIGRDAESERVIQILVRRQKNNPCLVGEPGVGKTAVVEGLALRIAEGRVPDMLKSKTIVSLDLASMIAGAKYRGEFEERMKNVMEEAVKNPDLILFVDELHTIIGAGAAEGAVDAANILKPALARGEIHLIGATTLEEYRAHIEKDSALERRFQSVKVGEPSTQDTVCILRGLRDKYEAHHKIKISEEAIEAAVSLSVRYIPDRFLPDKAIDLIDEAAAKVRLGSSGADGGKIEKLEKQITELKEIASENSLSYTVHLPLNLNFSDKERDISITKAMKVISATRALDPFAYVCHLECKDIPDREGEALADWQAQRIRAVSALTKISGIRSELAIENLERYPIEWNEPVIRACGTHATLDIGHLFLQKIDPVPVMREWLPLTSVIHLHGIGTRDHQSLEHMDKAEIKAVLVELKRQDYRGVVTLEVFNQDDFNGSMEVIRECL